MAGSADEQRAGIDEATREVAGAGLAGYGARAWRERLPYLRRAARCHGAEFQPAPGHAGGRPAVRLAPPPDGGEPPARAGARKETM
jgi:hypothetical protein